MPPLGGRPPVPNQATSTNDQLTSPSICLDRGAALRNEEMEAASWRPASLSPALLSVMVDGSYVRLVSPVSSQRA